MINSKNSFPGLNRAPEVGETTIIDVDLYVQPDGSTVSSDPVFELAAIKLEFDRASRPGGTPITPEREAEMMSRGEQLAAGLGPERVQDADGLYAFLKEGDVGLVQAVAN